MTTMTSDSTVLSATRSVDDVRPVPARPEAKAAAYPTEATPAPEAVVLVPGGVNYFYDQAGRRIADALAQIGCRAAIHTLRSVPPDTEFNTCFFVNLYELGVGFGQEDVAGRQLRGVQKGGGEIFSVPRPRGA